MSKTSNKLSPNLVTNDEIKKNRLLLLVVIFFVSWLMYLSQFSSNTDFTDDTSRVRVEDIRGTTADGDPTLDAQHSFLSHVVVNPFSFLIFFCLVILFTLEIAPRLIFLNQIRPRSPPL